MTTAAAVVVAVAVAFSFLVACRLLRRFDRVRVENNSARVTLAPATFTRLAPLLGVSLATAIAIAVGIGELVLDGADERRRGGVGERLADR